MTSRRASTDDSYQVDSIVALFAILIVLLLTLVTATSSDDSDAVTNYRPTDLETSQTKLRSLQIPYRLREFWTLDSDGIMRQIDSVALARVVREEGSNFSYQSSDNGLDVEIDLMTSELGSYRLRIDLFDTEAARWAIRRIVDPAQEEDLLWWASEPVSAVIFVDFEARHSLAPISAALENGRRKGRLIQLRSGVRYAILERSAARMSAQDIFRE